MDRSLRLTAPLTQIAASSDAIDSSRTIPDDLVSSMREAGLFRLLTPEKHDGIDATLPDVLRVIDEVSTADASVGWTIAQCAQGQLVLRHFSDDTVAEAFAAGPDLLVAGAVAPKGRAIRADGSWVIHGRWPFASGAPRATIFYVQCIEVSGTTPVLDATGRPHLRLALLPATDVEILDTWDTLGLRGTGSCDVLVNRAHCTDPHTCRFDAQPSRSQPVLRLPAKDLGGLFVAAVAVGNTAAALEDVVTLAAGGKRPAFSRDRLGSSQAFQSGLGEAAIRLRAARSLLYTEVDQAWHHVTADRELTGEQRAVLRATGSEVVRLSTEALDIAYGLGGGTSVFNRSPLPRRFRDGHTATQHFAVGPTFLPTLGSALLDGAAEQASS